MSDTSPSLLATLSDDLATAVERGASATVTVNARRRMPASGILWSADGLIVTANHVVERDDDITIGLPDGRTVAATLAGRDAGSDIAVLRVQASDLTAAVQSGETIKPGHLVLAIGRPNANGPMASFGAVSLIGGPISERGPREERGGGEGRPEGGPHEERGGRPDGRRGGIGPWGGGGRPGTPPFGGPGGGRPGQPPFGGRGGRGGFPASGRGIERFIRADVAMLPGFSGGPLVTARGEVAGLNTSHFGRWGGITLPNDVIDPIVASLAAHGKVRRGFLGIGLQAVQLPESLQNLANGQDIGLLAVNIEAGGPADSAGILLGDILLTLGGAPITNVESLQEQLTGDTVGAATPITIIRGGAAVTVEITVGERA